MNALEYALTNNPLRAAIQRHFEAKRLLAMGGSAKGRALEVGCGRGVGIEIILDTFQVQHVDGFECRFGYMAARDVASTSQSKKVQAKTCGSARGEYL